MATPPTKKAKIEDLPQCPYGSKCYRKNPAHFKEFSHSDSASTSDTAKVIKTGTDNTLPVCPFGATCYRKNLLHFAQYTHPFNLLNPDVDSSDDDDDDKKQEKVEGSKTTTTDMKDNGKKRKIEIDDGDKTEEYDTDDENVYDVKLKKTFSKMTDDEKRLMIEKAFELKEKLQEKLKRTREETEKRQKEIEQLQKRVSEGVLLMEGEEEILKGTKVKYFEIFPERNYKRGSAAELHFRLAESQFYRLLGGGTGATVTKVEYVCNPVLINKFHKAREELKKTRGEEYSYPILAFHGTAVTNILPICENGFKIPGQVGFQHATDTGFYGRGTYFSEYPGLSMGYIKGSTKLLLSQILQGKVYQCTQLIVGSDLIDGYDSHCSPDKKEIIIFRSDHILPQYIVHYKLNAGEFKYQNAVTKEAIKKKLAKIGKLYKKAVATKSKKIFTGYKFAFIGQMADTPLAIEALVKRFGGYVCKNAAAIGGASVTTGLFINGTLATVAFDAPNVIICSLAEYEAETPSAELQAYKNNYYQIFYREDLIYDCIIEGAMKTLNDYAHE